MVFTPIAQNLFLLATGQGYFIPSESSIWTFRATQMNQGSGEWWLRGEDGAHYYAIGEVPGSYLIVDRDAAVANVSADDPATWGDAARQGLAKK